jgi:hypothetical protein
MVCSISFCCVLGAFLAAGVFDEDTAHGLGGRGKKVAATVPASRLRLRGLTPPAHQEPKVSFMDQSGGVERLARFFACQLLSGQPAQLVINQRQQLIGRLRLSALDGVQELSEIVHQPRRYVESIQIATGQGRGVRVSGSLRRTPLSTDETRIQHG